MAAVSSARTMTWVPMEMRLAWPDAMDPTTGMMNISIAKMYTRVTAEPLCN